MQKKPCLCFCAHSSCAFFVSTTYAGTGHKPSFHSPNSCFSPQSFRHFSFDQMIIIFFTSSGHASFKFIFLAKKLYLATSFLELRAAKLQPTELRDPLQAFQTDFPTVVHFQTFSVRSSCFVPTTSSPYCHAVCRKLLLHFHVLHFQEKPTMRLPAALGICAWILYLSLVAKAMEWNHHVLAGTTLVIVTNFVPASKYTSLKSLIALFCLSAFPFFFSSIQ